MSRIRKRPVFSLIGLRVVVAIFFGLLRPAGRQSLVRERHGGNLGDLKQLGSISTGGDGPSVPVSHSREEESNDGHF